MTLSKSILFFLMAAVTMCSFSQEAFAQKRKKKKKVITTAELENTYWRLSEMDGKPLVTPADSKEVYIKLNSKKETLEGYTGCNLVTGNYDYSRDGLTFSAAVTEKLCKDNMSTEQYLLEAINNANRHEINGLYLLLFKDNYMLAMFEARYFDE